MATQNPDNGQEAKMETVEKHSDSTTSDRLQFLEKEYHQLSALFHDYLAEPADIDGKEANERERPSLPSCKITRIPYTTWKEMEYGTFSQNDFSVMIVGPKGREESTTISQPLKKHSEANGASTEAIPELTNASTSPDVQSYRMLLDGRAELMGVLGGMFSIQTMPGFYIWMWPFKYLIKYEKKVRARLAEEEAKFGDDDEVIAPKILQLPHNQAQVTTDGDESQQRSDDGTVPPSRSTADGDKADPRDPAQSSEEEGKEEEKNNVAEPEWKLSSLKAKHEIDADSDSAKPPLSTHDVPEIEEKAKNSVREPLEPTNVRIIEEDPTRLRDELRCIVEFMNEDMKDIFRVQRQIEAGTLRKIAFDYLWLLYKPGDVVISTTEQNRAYIVIHVTGGRALDRTAKVTVPELSNSYFAKEQQQEKEAYLAKHPKTTPVAIDCFYIDFDGTNFGPLPKKFVLAEYEGEVPIDSLEVYPLRFDDNAQQKEKALVKRGKRFVKLARVDHKFYSGKTLKEPPIHNVQEEVHGEVMIDFALAIGHGQKRARFDMDFWILKFGTGVIANPTQADEREVNSLYRVFSGSRDRSKPTWIVEDQALDQELRIDYIDKTTLLKERPYNEKLPNKALMLLPPRVYGFSLLDRKWCAFDLMKVEDIKNSGEGFENLVLSDSHKKIMQALVRNHMNGPVSVNDQMRQVDRDFSMDVVRGKGKGLIILLHGVPGVGKTSTAECVAAQTRRPLFPITCGDIGTSPKEVEERLNEYFDMAHKWGCVLLLDEADVFLAKREKGGDLVRNGVVSVFLRLLEYYSGILILTTNRIGEFDEAFSSRVHIKLYYPKLDKKSTLAIWRMNLKRIAESDLDIDLKQDEIMKFAKKLWADSAEKQTQRWNGRQIRNAFQSAIALAKWDFQEGGHDDSKPVLSVRQFEVVAQTSSHFDAYISTMHGIEESNDTWDTIAARELLRRNDTPRKPPPARSSAAMMGRTRGGGGGRKKVETSEDDDEDADDTDSDVNEEKMKKLKAKIEKLEKMKKPSPKKVRQSDDVKESQKVAALQAEKEDEDSSISSDDVE